MTDNTIYELSIGDKILIGRTNQDVEKRIKQHENLLKQGKHFNRVMQMNYDKNPQIDFIITHNNLKPEKAHKIFVEEINNKETYNSLIGFNHYLDRKIRKNKTYKTENSYEDIVFNFLDHGVFKHTQDEFGINYVTLQYHLNKYGVFKDSKPTVPSKKDMIYAGLQVLALAEKPLTSAQIVERIGERYNVANKINFTPRQISILLKVNGAQKVGKSPIVWVAP